MLYSWLFVRSKRMVFIMRVLLTGANGRLGKWLVKDLINCGHEPVLFTKTPVEYEEAKGLRQIGGDINDLKTYAEAMKGQRIYS